MIEQHQAFEFTGWSGNRAITDLTVIRRSGFEPPIVVATERDDNPGVSITNASEYLAAAVLAKVCPTRLDGSEPFVLIEHHRAQSFDLGNGDFEGLEHTFHQVHFADFRLQRANGVDRIGEVVAWGPIVENGLREIVEQSIKQAEQQSHQFAQQPRGTEHDGCTLGMYDDCTCERSDFAESLKENSMKDTLRPWEVEQIGEYYLRQAQTQIGTDGNRYQIEPGTYPIIGKVSNDGRKLLLDTSVVLTGRDERSREEALLPMKMPAVDIMQQHAQGKARIGEDFKQRVESLANGIEQGQAMAAGLGMRR